MRARVRKNKAAQYDTKTGELVYKIGISGGKSKSIESDLKYVKKPKNDAEGQLFDYLTSKGWSLTKAGWPDFFCVKNGEICLVEVKPRKTHSLKRNQLVIMGALSQAGIRCFLWSPDGGFEEVKGMRGQRKGP